MDDRIGRLASAPIQTYYKRKYCRLTRSTEFKDALSAIIGDVNLAKRVLSVHVERKRLEATVHWMKPGHTYNYDGKNMDLSNFAYREPYVQLPLAVEAHLNGSVFLEIAAALSGGGA